MTVASLFAGIGGFDLALERNGHQIVFANEWDKYAANIYDKHFSLKTDRRDITTIRAEDVPDHDLFVGGFPCQAFSVAGKRRGFDDNRGTLFFDIARILKGKRPSYFVLENVKGLLSHDAGNTIRVIFQTLDELGYDFQWQVCNSKNFGVPQNRERVFIVGHFRGLTRPEVFPLVGEEPRTLGKPVVISGRPIYGNRTRSMTYSLSDTVPTIRATQHKSGDNQPRIIDTNGRGYSDGLTESDTVDSMATQGAFGGLRIRRLTPVECERLQGFPDGWTEGFSDTQRYKCLGNAVTVNVAEAIINRLV